MDDIFESIKRIGHDPEKRKVAVSESIIKTKCSVLGLLTVKVGDIIVRKVWNAAAWNTVPTSFLVLEDRVEDMLFLYCLNLSTNTKEHVNICGIPKGGTRIISVDGSVKIRAKRVKKKKNEV